MNQLASVDLSRVGLDIPANAKLSAFEWAERAMQAETLERLRTADHESFLFDDDNPLSRDEGGEGSRSRDRSSRKKDDDPDKKKTKTEKDLDEDKDGKHKGASEDAHSKGGKDKLGKLGSAVEKVESALDKVESKIGSLVEKAGAKIAGQGALKTGAAVVGTVLEAPAVAVAGAAWTGYEVGGLLNEAGEYLAKGTAFEGVGTDVIGKAVAQVAAAFGNDDAARALAINEAPVLMTASEVCIANGLAQCQRYTEHSVVDIRESLGDANLEKIGKTGLNSEAVLGTAESVNAKLQGSGIPPLDGIEASALLLSMAEAKEAGMDPVLMVGSGAVTLEARESASGKSWDLAELLGNKEAELEQKVEKASEAVLDLS